MISYIQEMAKRLGYVIYPTWREGVRPHAQYLRRLFAAGSIDAVFDVGANKGQYRDFLRSHVGYKGRIFSFEPIPSLATLLEERAKTDPAWTIFPFALGRESGHLPINVTRSSVFSSFLKPKQDDQNELFINHTPIVESIQVEIKTLSSLFPLIQQQSGFSRPYLKLDTQGFDMEALAGAGDTLARFVALQTEAAVAPIYHGMPGYREVIAWLEARGFTLSAMHPVGDLFPELVEFDCHMVRSDLISELRAQSKALLDR
jgi:FkbM family methyltransferase